MAWALASSTSSPRGAGVRDAETSAGLSSASTSGFGSALGFSGLGARGFSLRAGRSLLWGRSALGAAGLGSAMGSGRTGSVTASSISSP